MEEKKKSSKLNKIISCVVIILLIFSLVQIATLNDKIENLSAANFKLDTEINSLRTSINSIYNNVDEKLKEQSSLITGMDYSIGKPNENMKTVPLSFTVVPKTVTDDMKLSITVEGVTAPLERNGNEFKGAIDVGLFMDHDQHPLLIVNSSAGTQTEYLEDIDISYLFTDYLPTLNADMSSSSRISDGTMHINSNLTISVVNENSDVTFTSFAIVEELNGKEIDRKNITDEVLKAGDDYNCDYSKSVEISDEYEFRVYVVAEDSLGYIHKNLANCWMESRMDAMIETVSHDVTIYNKDGNVLYNKYVY